MPLKSKITTIYLDKSVDLYIPSGSSQSPLELELALIVIEDTKLHCFLCHSASW